MKRHLRWGAELVFAAVMMVFGMLLMFGPVQKGAVVYEEERTGQQVQPVLAEAQPADERKEETSTTSQLYAQSAVLMDADNGRILLGKNEDQVLPMASTTKIMTCILTLELGNGEDIIPVSSYAAAQPKVHMGTKKGEYYKTKDLLYSLMLESHNDAAVILAEYYGSKWAGLSEDIASHSQEESKKAVTVFAEKMNEKAKKIGCQNTFFVTPNGLDGVLTTLENGERKEREHSTTAADLANIMRYCVWDSPASEEFLSITQTMSYTFCNYVRAEGGSTFQTGNKSISCTNHNAFLQMMEGALSGKTGFTGKAGYCYVGALEKDGKRFTIALLACGWPNHKTWKWHDSRILFEYGMENYEPRDIFEKKDLAAVPVENGQQDTAGLFVRKEKMELLLGPHDIVETEWELPEKLNAPVRKGEEVGKQSYYVNGDLYAVLPVLAEEEVLKITYSYCLKRIFWKALL